MCLCVEIVTLRTTPSFGVGFRRHFRVTLEAALVRDSDEPMGVLVYLLAIATIFGGAYLAASFARMHTSNQDSTQALLRTQAAEISRLKRKIDELEAWRLPTQPPPAVSPPPPPQQRVTWQAHEHTLNNCKQHFGHEQIKTYHTIYNNIHNN